VAQPVEAAANAFVAAAGPGVVTQCAPVHTGVERLLGGEVACLRLGDPVETVMVDSVRHTRDIIAQTSDMVEARTAK
jgi:hypothetical protein